MIYVKINPPKMAGLKELKFCLLAARIAAARAAIIMWYTRIVASIATGATIIRATAAPN